ncbi:MAG: NAD(P)/FAD-dependent oxidoreductase [Solirubrobacterales bacterium]
MTRNVDVLVVGAGSFGLNTAHHLVEAGLTVHVLERDRIAAATSTCGAGFVGTWAAGMVHGLDAPEVEMELYGADFYSRLHEERPTFALRKAGMLYYATDQEGWDTRLRPIAESTLVPGAEVLDAKGCAERGMVLDADHILGGVYHPQPIQVVAAEAIRVLGESLRDRGVEIRERTAVTDLIVEGGRIVGVETEAGRTMADRVVLTTAVWTNLLLRGHAAPLPYAPLGAIRITTEPLGLPEEMPMLMVPEVDAWIREEAGGFRWGGRYLGDHRMSLLDRDPPERFSELPTDWIGEMETLRRRLAKSIPPLAGYKDWTYAEGFPCYTPDKRPLLGPIPEIEGLFVIAGDGEMGITHGPGFGRELARQVAGLPTGPGIAERYRPDRFGSEYGSPRQVADELRRRREELDEMALES